jgi:hypothetical protein
MGTLRLLTCLSAALVSATLALAEPATAPQEATLTRETEVRSGPSPEFYVTTKLPAGSRVHIVKELEGGWLGIEPPPGSFNWVKDVLIERHGNTAIVLSDASLLVGSKEVNKQPSALSTIKVKAGSQVVILDTAMNDADGLVWWPIQPPPAELRYIAADAVKASSAVQAATVPLVPPAPTPAAAATATALNNDVLWQQAEQAERAGNYAEAIRLLVQLADQKKNDQEQWLRVQNRIQFLQLTQRNATPGRPTDSFYSTPAITVSRVVQGQPVSYAPTGGWVPQGQTHVTPTPQYTYTSSSAMVQPVVPMPAPTTFGGYGQAQPANVASMQSVGPGRFRRAPFYLDQKPAYALEDDRGNVLTYATASPNVNLDLYVYKTVTLQGSLIYNGHLKRNYMNVNGVTLGQ